MLCSLRIRNLALAEDLEWNLPGGFVAVTGETGSGKSLIIGALNLLLGDRADKSLIRTGAESCTVEAVFHMPGGTEMDAVLDRHGVEPCANAELIVKRVFSHTGANRQFVNCSATTLAVLKSIGDLLVDLHGPHDHQSLLAAGNQLDLLDAYADAAGLHRQYRQQYRTLHQLIAERDGLSASEASLDREIDLLKHQVAEIDAADLKPDEEESLLGRYNLAANSRRLTELAGQITQRLADADDALLGRLAETQRLLRELERIDPATAAFAQSHANALIELEEIDRSLRHYCDHLDINPDELARLEERVNLIQSLKRKYGATLPEVIACGENAAARLRKIQSRGEELDRLAGEIESARSALMRTGSELTVLRKKAAPKLAADIQSQLRRLGFKKSDFEAAILPLEQPAAHGLETVEFLFAPNPGEPPKPLKSIASSGEISRIMLAVKSSLAAQDRIPLLVFDEIDANVGGEIALAVGAKMQTLGAAHQVLCITHLPQVAAAAGAQFVVTKEFAENRTLSHLTEVKGKARIEEIARMLGGKTESAMIHARSLLESAVR